MTFKPPSPTPIAAMPNLPTPAAPPPVFGQDSSLKPGQKPKKQSMTPTFLGTGDTPQAGQLGQKTLLGQ